MRVFMHNEGLRDRQDDVAAKDVSNRATSSTKL